MPKETIEEFSSWRGLPYYSWKKHERVMEGLCEGIPINSKYKKLLAFLNAIGFIKIENNTTSDSKASLSEIGKKYYTKKFVQNKENEAIEILKNRLVLLKPVVILCSALWGSPNITKTNVEKALQVNSVFQDEYEMSSLLSLLNYARIIKYRKKTGLIIILYNPITKTNGGEGLNSYFVSRTKPYSNLLALKKALRECQGFITWIEKHFTKKIFELLVEESDGNIISKVSIITGPSCINTDVLKEFKIFKSELQNRGIKTSFKVIKTPQLFHGRWIMGGNVCYKIPPTNTVLQGQVDEITRTQKRPPLSEWENEFLDIEKDWNELYKLLRRKDNV